VVIKDSLGGFLDILLILKGSLTNGKRNKEKLLSIVFSNIHSINAD